MYHGYFPNCYLVLQVIRDGVPQPVGTPFSCLLVLRCTYVVVELVSSSIETRFDGIPQPVVVPFSLVYWYCGTRILLYLFSSTGTRFDLFFVTSVLVSRESNKCQNITMVRLHKRGAMQISSTVGGGA